MTTVVDASVWVNAAIRTEDGSAESRRVLRKLAERIICPSLALMEIAGSLARLSNDAERDIQAAQFVAMAVELVPVSNKLAPTASEIAARCRLRGADAVHVAVAMEHDAPLVTRDQEQLQRCREIVAVMTPEDFLQTNPSI